MITLTGTLRQAGEVTIKDKPKLKLVVEHETARDNGVPDLHLETLFVDRQDAAKLPKPGQPVHVEVRPYALAGSRNVSFSAVRVLGEDDYVDPSAAK